MTEESRRSASTAQLDHALEQALGALRDRRAPEWLRRYFDPDAEYAGHLLLGVRPEEPWRITAADLYAVSLVGGRIGALEGRRFLDSGSAQTEIDRALEALDPGAELAAADEEVLDAGERLYAAVKAALEGNRWETASKVCARKRPALFPVRDRLVTRDVLGGGRHPRIDWQIYRHLLLNEEVSERLAGLARDAALDGAGVVEPPLRILDVVLRMQAEDRDR